ncbi:MAG: nucleotide exchange factor GrpE [Kiloniellales bacterium]|nr:nucleotide exchange factor GrpE [Kiloniellales bacterium]
MTDSERKAEQAEPETESAEAPEEAAASPLVEENEIPTIEGEEVDPLLALQAEVGELKDKLLRQTAETENVRRRLQRDKTEALKHASAPLLRDLLAVADNLERALGSLPEGAVESDGPIAQLATGLELTRKELTTVFERHGVTRVEAEGERLDPHVHEAMYEIEDPSVPAGTILQVMEAGYRLHDRLLRAARVGVAKGGPPAPVAEPEPQPEAEAAPAKPANGTAENPEPGTHVDTEA